jgi:hypothetical protein
MIPSDIVALIHGPQVMYVATRSQALRPLVRRVAGAIADAASDTVTVFLPDPVNRQTIENATDNGRIAFLLIDAYSHRSYQLKGSYLSSRPSTTADKAVRDLYMEKIAAHMRNWFVPIPDEFWNGVVLDPSTSLSFRVETIFDQTPGPNAGKPVPYTPSAAR